MLLWGAHDWCTGCVHDVSRSSGDPPEFILSSHREPMQALQVCVCVLRVHVMCLREFFPQD